MIVCKERIVRGCVERLLRSGRMHQGAPIQRFTCRNKYSLHRLSNLVVVIHHNHIAPVHQMQYESFPPFNDIGGSHTEENR